MSALVDDFCVDVAWRLLAPTACDLTPNRSERYPSGDIAAPPRRHPVAPSEGPTAGRRATAYRMGRIGGDGTVMSVPGVAFRAKQDMSPTANPVRWRDESEGPFWVARHPAAHGGNAEKKSSSAGNGGPAASTSTWAS